MKMLVAGLVALSLAGAARAEENVLTSEEQAAGWTLLFDGKDTAGWHSYHKKKAGARWKVADGILSLTKGGGGDLVTNADYANFELVFEWRISPRGNSGVMYHVSEKGGAHPYLTGPEYQLLDNAHLPEPPLEQAGALFGLYAPERDVTKPTGEFNQSRLVVDHGKVEHWLNGVKIVEYTIGSEDFSHRIVGTKFAGWKEFAKHETGGIVLQDHGDPVAFRNIKVRTLP